MMRHRKRKEGKENSLRDECGHFIESLGLRQCLKAEFGDLWGTKNKSGSICSVLYLVCLKHATGPAFLNLWNRIKWRPETGREMPHQSTVSKQQKGRIFYAPCHATSYDFPETPPFLYTAPNPDSPHIHLIKQLWDFNHPKGQQLRIQNNSHHNRLSRVWNVCSGSPYFRKQLSSIRLIMRGRQSFCPLLRNNSYMEQLY